MRWRGRKQSAHVEDRRGVRARPKLAGGGIGLLVLVGVGLFLGVDPSALMQVVQTQQQRVPAPTTGGAKLEDEQSQFVAVVLADTEDTWNEIFGQSGRNYREPSLVLFSGSVRSACGFAQAAMGPFYCPADQKVYIDLSFYSDLQNRFQAPGDFAQAYVIAHEVGHHVQTLLGVSEQVQRQKARLSKAEANQLSVRQELQADCLAGIWAHHADRTRALLEQGDIEEGLNAASAIGDDRLQKQSRGYVTPESFTHGSSAQRVKWFKRGYASGDVNACDTFGEASL
ncbi:MAG: zinc metallopeptidase [Deltaproteobacteria bacterium]|nr:zinc metallopeptidase [Deltaproteobacteria bacterium]NND29715.1 zinc metallopeptidase [Myxococcales bacterium]MBT8465716.1 zinc metallopeptidase [Deltaproteobacteria bacterium]MBT8482240.1 zinc metallopeptidase [Deltaproteobacteria bacterium]NNK06396.1 zinc metallopeptidase [Myxococcales bacterium]